MLQLPRPYLLKLAFACLLCVVAGFSSESRAANKDFSKVTIKDAEKMCQKCRSGNKNECTKLQLISAGNATLEVQLVAIECLAARLTDQPALAALVSLKLRGIEDRWGRGRLSSFVTAVSRINRPDLLKDVARNAYYHSPRIAALKQLNDQALIEQYAVNGDNDELRLAVLALIRDQGKLAELARKSSSKSFVNATLFRITDEKTRISVAESGIALDDLIFLPRVELGQEDWDATYVLEETNPARPTSFNYRVAINFAGDNLDKLQFRPPLYSNKTRHKFLGHIFIPLIANDADYVFEVKKEPVRTEGIPFSFSGGELKVLSVLRFSALVSSSLKENVPCIEVNSSKSSPLVLEVTEQGYKYVEGSGTVKLPLGKVYKYGN